MADQYSGAGGYTRGSRDLDFITGNPAMEAYQAGQKFDTDQETKTLANDFSRASNPTRLRQMNLNADTTAAELPGHVADTTVKVGTVPYRIQEQANTARAGVANADTAEATRDVAVATVPDKIQQQGPLRTRLDEAHATNAEMEPLHKELALLERGDIQGAIYAAAARGQTIPTEVLNDATTRQYYVEAGKYAEKMYPNRPQAQHDSILMFLEGVKRAKAAALATGQPESAFDPASLFSVPGAPTPAETSGAHNFDVINRSETDENGKPVVRSYKIDKRTGEMTPVEGEGGFSRATGAGAGGSKSVYTQKRMDWLSVHPGDEQGALDYAAGRRQLSGAELVRSARAQAIQEINGNMQLKFKADVERNAAINRRADENLQRMQEANQLQKTARPGASMNIPQPGQISMKGNGTQGAPYQVQTKEDYDEVTSGSYYHHPSDPPNKVRLKQ